VILFLTKELCMANEVVIIEARRSTSGAGTAQGVFGDILTTQVLDLATVSAELSADTEIIRIIAHGAALWYKGGVTASAAAAAVDTDGNAPLALGDYIDLEVNPKVLKFIDTAA